MLSDSGSKSMVDQRCLLTSSGWPLLSVHLTHHFFFIIIIQMVIFASLFFAMLCQLASISVNVCPPPKFDDLQKFPVIIWSILHICCARSQAARFESLC